MEEEKKEEEKGWRKIYEFKGEKTTAVIPDPYDREEIMLLDPPHHIGVMDGKRKEELLKWLVSLWLRRLLYVEDMGKEKKEKILRLLALLLVELEP